MEDESTRHRHWIQLFGPDYEQQQLRFSYPGLLKSISIHHEFRTLRFLYFWYITQHDTIVLSHRQINFMDPLFDLHIPSLGFWNSRVLHVILHILLIECEHPAFPAPNFLPRPSS